MENQETPQNQDPSPNQDAPADAAASPPPGGLGKYKLLISVVIVGLIATGYFATRQSVPVAVGNMTEAAITLITSDRGDVDCAMEASIDGFHCGFSAPDKPFEVAEKNKLQPFYTLDRRLLLIPGLFLDPNVEMRYKSELPTGKARDQLARFTARCQVRIQKTVPDVRVRWLATDNFGDPTPAEMATVVDCKIEN